MLHLMANLWTMGAHAVGWRHPEAWDDTVMNLDALIETARIAERGKFDVLFVADGNGVRHMDNATIFESGGPADRPVVHEPTTLLAAVSQHTSHIGLVATSATTYDVPYMVARRFASLDHISGGRAGWNVVTGASPGDSKNFGFDEHVEKGERYARAKEFVEVVKGLWDSWSDDAFVQDKSKGRLLDLSRVRTLDHSGTFFTVQGPLNAPRTPQGHPVVFHAGQSEAGLELAAEHADCVFAFAPTMQDGRELYSNLKSRLPRYGRERESMKILPSATFYVGRNMNEAEDLVAELGALIPAELGVPYLSKMVHEDLSGYPVDGPLPDLSAEVPGLGTWRKQIARMAAKENLTIRQVFERVMPTMGNATFVGGPIEIADQLEEWYRQEAADGFLVGVGVAPLVLRRFVDLVVPELQRRGLTRTEYEGTTLRSHLGLQVPPNMYF